jgi:ATP-dependent RNA helicase DDX27
VSSSKKSKKDVEEETEGIWGPKDKDDGAMDPDFEFAVEEGDQTMQDFEGWGFEGAKKGLGGDKRAVDIDEIIARRREKKNGGKKDEGEPAGVDDSDSDSDGDEAEALKLGTSDNLPFHLEHLGVELLNHVFGAVSKAQLPSSLNVH